MILATLLAACSAPARSFRATAAASLDYPALLERYVSPGGGVDYTRWKANAADVAALDRVLAVLAAASPDSAPARFRGVDAALSYWINLYNALVLREVIRRWPLDSVRDVTPTLSSHVIRGKGFFRDLEFVVGGRALSLDDIEHRILRRQFEDPRIHFAINCGSASCPALSHDAFDPADVQRQLERAAHSFINDPRNVAVDPGRRAIRLSRIFDWYRDDFVAAARKRAGARAGVVEFLLPYARPELAAALVRARADGYEIAYDHYDWSVNQAKPSAIGVGRLAPAVAVPRLDGGTWTPADDRGKVVLLDFWATYCAPCKQALPELARLATAYGARGLVVVAVSVDDADSDAEIRSFVAAHAGNPAPSFVVGLDPDLRTLARALSVTALPTEVLIDRDGVIRARYQGPGAPEHEVVELLGDRAAR